MLRESRVRQVTFDEGRDELCLVLDAAPPQAHEAQLLLDSAGFLVGVDVGTEPARLVAMLGRHESVAEVRPGRIRTDGSRVYVVDARRAARAHEPNPHAPR